MEQFQITIFNKQYNDHNYKIMELIKLANTVKMQKKKKGGVLKALLDTIYYLLPFK